MMFTYEHKYERYLFFLSIDGQRSSFRYIDTKWVRLVPLSSNQSHEIVGGRENAPLLETQQAGDKRWQATVAFEGAGLAFTGVEDWA